MVGYIYQCEYALYRALNTDDPVEYIFIETLDDVVVEGVNNALELLQLKHHDEAKPKAFTDKSKDLWKTIRIWSTLIAEGKLSPEKMSFYLLTTSLPSTKSKLIKFLAPKNGREGRDAKLGLETLVEVAEDYAQGENDDFKKLVAPFLSLDPATRLLLVSNITIVSGEPLIDGLRKKIMQRLSFSGAISTKKELFAQTLLGWWYWIVVEKLRSKIDKHITREQLEERIADTVAAFAVSELPTFDDIQKPDSDVESDLKRRLFVRQLEKVGHKPDRTMVAQALVDFFKADGHIKRWMETFKLTPDEIESFREKLHAHWKTKFGAIEPEIDLCAESDESTKQHELRKLGQKALDTSLTGCEASLKNLKEDYLRRGVLHIMANEPILGWHPNWLSLFKQDE